VDADPSVFGFGMQLFVADAGKSENDLETPQVTDVAEEHAPPRARRPDPPVRPTVAGARAARRRGAASRAMM
jgi:hypothetical protein